MSGADPAPCSVTMSFSRVDDSAAPCTPKTATSAARAAAWRTVRATTFLPMTITSEHLVEHTNEPPRAEAVFHQPPAEIANLQLSERGRRHDVARGNVGDAGHAGQHDDL